MEVQKMEDTTTTARVTLTDADLGNFDPNDPAIIALVGKAKAAQDADHSLTVWQAVKKYKTAAAWAMFLSTALVMEGFDLTIVSTPLCHCQLKQSTAKDKELSRLVHFTARHNSSLDSASGIRTWRNMSSVLLGYLVCPTLP